eukprot:NODE_2663_length_886_cov_89.191159_g2193_i0.p1 GENE.NODE_2663_length_886_cov_89.191159_g2193_i0~~NODE_2663_length_886_cov_89.191159_g2193_i0.p1  ORF type:complete len:264 (-),score=67.36 NODE_2663_length_886_cov_89.191159_g2193_i0:93-791(-)
MSNRTALVQLMQFWDDVKASLAKHNTPAVLAESAVAMGLENANSWGSGNLYLRFQLAREMIVRRCADDIYKKYSGVLASVDAMARENCYALLLETTSDAIPFPMYATVDIGPNGGACATGGPCGRLFMKQMDGNMLHVIYDVWGIGANATANLHVHTSDNCAATGERYSPAPMTTGDVGTVMANAAGKSIGLKEHTYVKLYGTYSIMARSVVLSHANGTVAGCGPVRMMKRQ